MDSYDRTVNLYLTPSDYVEIPLSIIPPNSLWVVLAEDSELERIDFPTTIPTNSGSVEITETLRNVVVRYIDLADGKSLPVFGDGGYGIYARTAKGELERRRIVGCELGGYLPPAYASLLESVEARQLVVLYQLSLYLGFRELEDIVGVAFAIQYNCLNKEGQVRILQYASEVLPPVNDLQQWVNKERYTLSTGDAHTFVLTVSGRLYACGNNDYGQLGLGDTENRTTFTLVPTPEPIITVVAKQDHTFLITTTGKLYVCGGDEGEQTDQMGLDFPDEDEGYVSRFTYLPTPAPVLSLVAGYGSTFIITADWNVYGCGSNEREMLSLGEGAYKPGYLFKPVLLQRPVHSLSLGEGHSVLLTVDGEVYTCGDNEDGQLALQEEDDENDDHFGRSDRDEFTQTPLSKVVHVATGPYQTFAITEAGELYACGNNGFGCLGLGPDTNDHGIRSFTPLPHHHQWKTVRLWR